MHAQFFIAWVVISIIWLWGTMLVAIFYPLVDGGIQQMRTIYRGLTSQKTSPDHGIPSQEDAQKNSAASSVSQTSPPE